MSTLLRDGWIANASAMGFNWVYNMPYLAELAKEQSLLFQPVDPAKYKRAGKAYLAYPHAVVGTISVQGEIAKWLRAALAQDPALTPEQYIELLFEQFKPGGDYRGWVESYGKQIVINKLSEQVKATLPNLVYSDDQMVGLVPYWVCKDLGLSKERAFELTQALTQEQDFLAVFAMFDHLLHDLPTKGMRPAIKEAIKLAPASMKVALQKALDLTNTTEFITNHSGTACHIPQAIPLIVHILYHTTSLEEALEKNVVLGGASCDRAQTIGALAGVAYSMPPAWLAYSVPL
jgi:hypothetical protein